MRTGLVAKKIGMTRYYTEDGEHLPATILLLESAQVVGARTMEKDGYTALQIGVGTRKSKNVAKPQREVYAKLKVEPKAKVVEFRVSEDALLDLGTEIVAGHFVEGQYIDATGTSIGKGFAGGMKRHNFRGLEASHGVSVSHRSHGSVGQCQDPGRVFKGKKMAGHMGAVRSTTQNLQIILTDDAEGLIVVKGAVPGSKGGYVLINDAVKMPLPASVPYPAATRGASTKAAAVEPTGSTEGDVSNES